MNLIPDKSNMRVLNYFCTWHMQACWRNTKLTDVRQRDRLDNEFLFASDGVFMTTPKEVRGDILALIDDGWDVPYGTNHINNVSAFGSLIPDAQRFKEFAHLDDKDRLKAISDKVKELGYAGLGLWVPSSHFGENEQTSKEERLSEGRTFWEEKGRLCAYADIKYLKVDWGYHGRDARYRKVMNESIKKYSPDTVMEHVVGVYDGPFEPEDKAYGDASYGRFMKEAKEAIAVSDVYRTYDVVRDFADVTTLKRLSKLFEAGAVTDRSLCGVINVEDSVIVAAALGMSMGIMRHEQDGIPDSNDVIKALKWQRIAPPTRFDECSNLFSKKNLYDSKFYGDDFSAWWHEKAETKVQNAPAIVSRNTPLAKVLQQDSDNVPFVLNSKNTVTGAYTVATLGRIKNNYVEIPLCDVSVSGADVNKPVGVFGSYSSLEIAFNSDVSGRRVMAQNLMSDEALDVTAQVSIKDNTVRIDGSIIDYIGKNIREDDGSTNGVVFLLCDI